MLLDSDARIVAKALENRQRREFTGNRSRASALLQILRKLTQEL